ncbi:MAG: J domain-containing protein [Candidatus Saccharimonadales bacterium]
MFVFEAINHYKSLGLESTATLSQIKSAYRGIARKCHPDTVGDDSRREEFDQALKAYEVLSNPMLRVAYDRTNGYESNSFDNFGSYFGFQPSWYPQSERVRVDVPSPETMVFEGVSVGVVYSHTHFSSTGLRADLYVQFDSAHRLTAFPVVLDNRLSDLHVMYRGVDLFQLYEYGRVPFVDLMSHNLNSHHIYLLKIDHRHEQIETLSGYSEECELLRSLGLPCDKLDTLMSRARNFTSEWRFYSIDKSVAAVAAVRNELQFLQSFKNVEQLFADRLMSGEMRHQHMSQIAEAIAAAEQCHIRSGGFSDLLDEAALYDHYLKRVKGLTTVDDVRAADLQIPIDEIVLSEADMEELGGTAPAKISLRNRKGKEIEHDVNYGYHVINGERTAVGVIHIGKAIYDCYSYEYAKDCGLPVLPHGIQLFLVVVESASGRMLGQGLNDKSLLTAVEKTVDSLKRSKIVDSMSMAMYAAERMPPPPWFRGKR